MKKIIICLILLIAGPVVAEDRTANYDLAKPSVSSDKGQWGYMANDNRDTYDVMFKELADTLDLKLNVSDSITAPFMDTAGLKRSDTVATWAWEGCMKPTPSWFETSEDTSIANPYGGHIIRVGDTLYMFERESESGNTSNRLAAMDLVTGKWYQMSNMAFNLNSQGALGTNGTDVYYTNTNKGSAANSFRIYATQGDTDASLQAFDAALFSGSSDGGMGGNMPFAPDVGAAGSFFYGGAWEQAGGEYGNKWFRYDIALDTWIAIQSAPDTFDLHFCSEWGQWRGKLGFWVHGGEVNSLIDNRIYYYNYNGDTWYDFFSNRSGINTEGGVFVTDPSDTTLLVYIHGSSSKSYQIYDTVRDWSYPDVAMGQLSSSSVIVNQGSVAFLREEIRDAYCTRYYALSSGQEADYPNLHFFKLTFSKGGRQ